MPRHAADRKCCGVSKFVDQKRRLFFRKRQKIHPLPSIIGSVRNSDHAKGAGGVFLHYEIFLDLLFAENLLLNYTILRLSSFLLKRSATRRRSFAAAALGAGYAVLYAVLARYRNYNRDGEIWLQNHDSTGSCGGNGRLYTVRFSDRQCIPPVPGADAGKGNSSFSSFRECRICGNAPPAEDPKGDAPGTRQAGYGTACAEW